MAAIIKENFSVTNFMEKVFSYLIQVDMYGGKIASIMVNGNRTKYMASEECYGQMGDNMRVFLLMTKNKDMENSVGQMEESTQENGKMESSMEMVTFMREKVL